MKILWIILDIAISTAAFFGILALTQNIWAVVIAAALSLWSFADGQVRARFFNQ